jgi:hypothetical protein
VNCRILVVALCLLAPHDSRAQLTQLCPTDLRSAARAALYNDAKRTLAEIFDLQAGAAVIDFASADWTGRRDELRARIDEVLRARPRFLTPQIIWAEGADLRTDTFTTTLRRTDGAAARLGVAGYQVCLRDANGDQWFFRKVPLDLWPE